MTVARPQPRIAILGAGMSGVCMGVRLRQAGLHDFTILEKSAALGGTWRDNIYPGAQCDVRSHLYCFSFAPNPGWSRVYAPQAEIRDYMERVARRWSLHERIRFGTELAAARFDATKGCWNLSTRAGDTLEADVLVCSTGPLSTPRFPDIPGLHDFGGKLVHSARWDPGYDFTGKSVAVIGTAASAVQLVPQLAKSVARLHVFQRTPNWIVPRMDRPYRWWEQALFRLPLVGRLPRWSQYWLHERNRLGFNPGTRMATLFERFARSHLARQVPDPALREKLEPAYPLGCKRVLPSNDYYPALTRPHVELVTDPIERIDTTGLVTRDGRHRRVDAIVCATGFDTHHLLGSVEVRGLEGQLLSESWRDAPQAYHGITVAGFPNLFLLLGPNTGTGHTSTLLYIEAQAGYALRCLDELRRRGSRWLAVKSEVMAAHNRALQQRLSTTVWAGPCSSWYKTSSGHISAIWPGFTREYLRGVRQPHFDHYAFG